MGIEIRYGQLYHLHDRNHIDRLNDVFKNYSLDLARIQGPAWGRFELCKTLALNFEPQYKIILKTILNPKPLWQNTNYTNPA